MNVDRTLALLSCHAELATDPEKVIALMQDIIEAAKFNLGSRFTDVSSFSLDSESFNVPKLLYDKMYFEMISIDGNRYGAFFENYGEYGVCGQMFVEAYGISNQGIIIGQPNNAKKTIQGLFPIGLLFVQEGKKLLIHHGHDERLKEKQIDSIIALSIIIKAIATINASLNEKNE